MKKFILPILLFLMFIPLVVNAETCDTDKISISSIAIESKSDNVEELSEATASGKNINLNISMSEVGDNNSIAVVFLCLGSSNLCLGSVYLNKDKDRDNVNKNNKK